MRWTLVELPAFTRAMEQLGLPDAWLADLQEELLLGRGQVSRPRSLGGFRKIRAPNPGRGKGKSGGLRVYFIRFDELETAVLAQISEKDVEANISPRDQRALARLASELRKELTHEQE